MPKRVLLCGMAALFLSLGSLSFADPPPGLDKKDKTPPGFAEGEKAGWRNGYPPGWDKKDAKGQAEWKLAVKLGRDRLNKHCKERGLSESEAESAADDFEKAARKGLAPEESESLVTDKIKENRKGKALSDAVAAEVQKRLKKKGEKPADQDGDQEKLPNAGKAEKDITAEGAQESEREKEKPEAAERGDEGGKGRGKDAERGQGGKKD